MKKTIKTAVLLLFSTLLLLTVCPVSNVVYAESLPYGEASSWFVEELDKAAEYGLITDRIHAKMDIPITREEFCEVVVSLYVKITGKPAVHSGTSSFIDTRNPEIYIAFELGIVNGVGDNRFDPGGILNREQMAAMIYRTISKACSAENLITDGIVSFSDQNLISTWAIDGLRFMYSNGIIKGTGGDAAKPTINPQGIATREQAVVMAYRAFNIFRQDSGSEASGDTTGESGNISSGSSGAIPVKGFSRISGGGSGDFGASYGYGLLIKEDGSLWGWGDGLFTGVYDTGYGSVRPIFGGLLPEKITDNVVYIEGGASHYFVVKSDGSLWAYGSNEQGKLGIGVDLEYYARPQKIMDNVKMASASYNNGAAVKNDGSLWVWGSDLYHVLGEIGLARYGSTQYCNTPEKLMDDVSAVSLGLYHILVLKNDGSVWSWGTNEGGELGDGKTTNYRTQAYKVMDGAVEIYAGNQSSCAVKNDGSLWVWGSNINCQMGIGTQNTDYVVQDTDYVVKPRKLMDNVKMARIEDCCGAALKNDGTLWTWGFNGVGTCGTGSENQRFVASPVKILENVVDFCITYDEAFALLNDGSIWGWGDGIQNMQLDSAVKIRYSPTQIGLSIKPDKNKEEPVVSGLWNGDWETDWGSMSLVQSGNSVNGTYVSSGYLNTIKGTVSGSTLTGTFEERGGYSGNVEFSLSADGQAFTGRCRYTDSEEWYPWNGSKK